MASQWTFDRTAMTSRTAHGRTSMTSALREKSTPEDKNDRYQLKPVLSGRDKSYEMRERRSDLDSNFGRMHVSDGISCGSAFAAMSEVWSSPFTNAGHGTLNCNPSAIIWAWFMPSLNMIGGRVLRASAAVIQLRWTYQEYKRQEVATPLIQNNADTMPRTMKV